MTEQEFRDKLAELEHGMPSGRYASGAALLMLQRINVMVCMDKLPVDPSWYIAESEQPLTMEPMYMAQVALLKRFSKWIGPGLHDVDNNELQVWAFHRSFIGTLQHIYERSCEACNL